MWRLRAVDPDYGVWGGYVDIVAGSNPAWVTFGPRVAPDVNQYAFAPKNLNCVGDVTDPNVTFVASRRIKIAPPANVYGNFDIKFSTTDSNQTSYWRIPFVVSRPQNMGVTSNAGPD
jgi:hypothetical protein